MAGAVGGEGDRQRMTNLFSDFFVSVLIIAHIEIFSVSCMGDFFYIPDHCPALKTKSL